MHCTSPSQARGGSLQSSELQTGSIRDEGRACGEGGRQAHMGWGVPGDQTQRDFFTTPGPEGAQEEIQYFAEPLRKFVRGETQALNLKANLKANAHLVGKP